MRTNAFMSISKYVKTIDNTAGHLFSREKSIYFQNELFPPEIIKFGMLKWNDDSAYMWCGPYKGNYCFCSILDHSMTSPNGRTSLPSKSELLERLLTYCTYSTYNVPFNVFKRVFHTDKHSFVQKTVDGQYCSRSAMTLKEYKMVVKSMTDYLELYKWENNIRNKYRSLKEEWLTHPTIETPIVFHLIGDDDTSYTKCYETIEDSLKYFNHLVRDQPDFNDLKKEGFVFTN